MNCKLILKRNEDNFDLVEVKDEQGHLFSLVHEDVFGADEEIKIALSSLRDFEVLLTVL